MHWDYIKQQHFEFFKIKINRTFCSQLPHHDLHYYTDGLQNKNKVNSEQVLCNSKNNILRGWFCDELLNMTYQEVKIISQALHADEDVELGEHLSVTCKSVKLNSHCGNQCGCSSGRWEFSMSRSSYTTPGDIPEGCFILPQRNLLNHVHLLFYPK